MATISTLIPITTVLGLAGFISPFVLGTGITNPVGGTISMMYMLLIPSIYAFCGFLVGLGTMLAIYVPLIPFMVFTFGVIGWFLATIEAMVAGPLVALGIISPSGEHELMGKAQPAIMLLFNLFLRPSLMIFGLMAAMLLATVVLSMINTAWYSLVRPAVVSGTTSNALVTLVVLLTAYTTLVVAALNKCFAAVYLIPQQVMTWISGQAQSYGEGEALAGIQGKTEAAGQAAGQAAGGAEATTRGATDTTTKGMDMRGQAKREGIASVYGKNKKDDKGGGNSST